MSAARKYTVAICGTGKRGKVHAEYFHKDERFQVVGIAGRNPEKLDTAAQLAGNPEKYLDVAKMLRETKPDIFCFCTPPTVRLSMVRLGVEHGAELMAYEKPMATSFNEAAEITNLCRQAGVKTVVCHQLKYGDHFQKAREIIASGSLGRVHTVYGHTLGWLLQMGTHVMDYCRFLIGEPEGQWVVGQACGREKLTDSHPSPDYLAGEIQFANGVRGIVQIGNLAPDVPEVEYFWHKVRIGAQGTEGFAEALIGGGWRAVTRDSGGPISGPGTWSAPHDQPLYIRDIALWLDDPGRVHPCNGESAFRGFELLMALCRSALERRKVALPLEPGEPEIEGLARIL
ncbi:MAG TPA: Gfo/Idh/MocA family oxidoreductase [Terriglobia bacterium]|nr:Gfo/Idh/MocA family oxidoreductase [Terriglobia bacterium]